MTELEYLLPAIDDLPTTLTDLDQWVCWKAELRDGKPTKVPINPRTGSYASTTDSETWTNFDGAHGYAMDAECGLGFVFSEEVGLVGVDLDGCRDAQTGQPDSIAKEIVQKLDSYTEVSPSGTGYHVIVEGQLPEGRNRRDWIELYDSARFFTVTGLHVEGTPDSVESRSEELAQVYWEHVGQEESGGRVPGNQKPTSLSNSALLERARSAKNGEKFDRLWRGSTAGYASQSEADMALCCLLAFWTGGDASKIDSLFRDSGLMREKWDEQHYSDGSTYGEVTIERAVDITDEFYEPRRKSDLSDPSSDQQHGRATSSSYRSRGRQEYEAERAQLLEQRVRELEALLKLKQERIETLEQQIDRGHATVDPSTDTVEVETKSAESDDGGGLLRRLFR